MSQDRSSISDVVQKGMNAANTVRGAVKAGKSIAAAAKGGAASGWIGAVAAFAWENRRLVAAITIGIIVIFLLPVVIISMLPSIVFGGTNNAYSPDDINNPILNNPAVINANIETLYLGLNEIFVDGLSITLEDIENDKLSLSEGAVTQIIYPTVEEDGNYKSLLISQYCAYMNDNYKDISIDGFKTFLSAHSDKIYSFNKQEEITVTSETVITVDANGNEIKNIVETEEKRVVYTVFYNGEDYFAENIFGLSESQKELANNYSQNLKMFTNEGV